MGGLIHKLDRLSKVQSASSGRSGKLLLTGPRKISSNRAVSDLQSFGGPEGPRRSKQALPSSGTDSSLRVGRRLARVLVHRGHERVRCQGAGPCQVTQHRMAPPCGKWIRAGHVASTNLGAHPCARLLETSFERDPVERVVIDEEDSRHRSASR